MAQDALAEFGLKDPGGDAPTLHRDAQGWVELSAYLTDHSTRMAALADLGLRQGWQGEVADAVAFAERVDSLARRADGLSYTAAAVGARQQQHARTHAQVVQIIVEVVVMIAALLAFWAAAWALPPLAEAVRWSLIYLIGTGVRALQILAKALQSLVRFLVRARTWIKEVSQLAWRGERFAIGYGRMLVEGTRDLVIDASANLVAAGVTGRRIDPAQVLISAGISGMGGAVVGGLERSGVRKALDDAGNVRRGADGRPEFVTFESQARDLARRVGPPQRPDPPAALDPEATRLFNDLQVAHEHATARGVTGTPTEGKRLADELTRTRSAHDRARIEHGRAVAEVGNVTEELARRERTVVEHRDAVEQAEFRLRSAESTLAVYQASGNPTWIREAVREVEDAHQGLDAATEGLREARLSVTASENELRRVQRHERLTGDAVAAYDDVVARADAWNRLDTARAAAQRQTTISQKWEYLRTNNEWSTSFDAPRSWQDVVLYDVPKEFLNGVASGATKSGIELARGNGSPEGVWQDALLRGGTGAVRGGVNSAAANRAFPDAGIEETLWKTGSKAMDIYIRDQVMKDMGKP